MPFHILLFILYVLLILLTSIFSYVILRKKSTSFHEIVLSGTPVYLILFMLFSLNEDAGKARTDIFNALNKKYESFNAQKIGTAEDGLSMYEYWVNKNLIDLYSTRYMYSFVSTIETNGDGTNENNNTK